MQLYTNADVQTSQDDTGLMCSAMIPNNKLQAVKMCLVQESFNVGGKCFVLLQANVFSDIGSNSRT